MINILIQLKYSGIINMINLIEYENNYFEIFKNHNDIVYKINLISKEINEFYNFAGDLK